ncbi:MAG: mechanosensitive ion channel protein MscS [Arenimonas sp. SCN 70-307]|uniref:mechanosensitive ion channel family protein n=1 Tax=Arenimonas sp. SCN 70-307 TaxID=1660089 RepID=UPI00086E2C8C|nr:mechanosensitive ion channel domain-containing protein [Arenimonas sp. SCN 70-307]ODS63606.1 MAG: mechanosensitive ion channel protein MscS [Arenimonas sp. SCN 70-307]
MELLNALYEQLAARPWLLSLLAVVALLLLAWLADQLTRRLLLRLLVRLVQASPVKWDDAILGRGVIKRLSRAVPAVVVYLGAPLLPDLPEGLLTVVRNVAAAYVVVTVAQAASALLSSLQDIYEGRDPVRARNRPIKGYLQVAKIVLFVLAAVLVMAVLVERSPLLLLSGFGAMTAVLMLVFKDTILSLVASVQIQSNDMVRVGDWIEMPKYGADGDVIDVALHTVKVQNWDRTITTIPTHALIADSFRNWRGMSESGGRRIKRALPIDQGTVRYLTNEEREGLSRFVLLQPYLEKKAAELAAWNATQEGRAPVNLRRLTNLGTFRAYARAYLQAHPGIHQGMTLLVRQLPPGPAGLPIEVYCFTATTAWAEYEDIQSDIFDHLLAILPEFGLRAYQQPSGADVAGLWEGLQARPASRA